jgi:hypothetical protein
MHVALPDRPQVVSMTPDRLEGHRRAFEAVRHRRQAPPDAVATARFRQLARHRTHATRQRARLRHLWHGQTHGARDCPWAASPTPPRCTGSRPRKRCAGASGRCAGCRRIRLGLPRVDRPRPSHRGISCRPELGARVIRVGGVPWFKSGRPDLRIPPHHGGFARFGAAQGSNRVLCRSAAARATPRGCAPWASSTPATVSAGFSASAGGLPGVAISPKGKGGVEPVGLAFALVGRPVP